jgi:septum formation protein
MGTEVAGRGDLEGPQARVSVPPAPPILLASVSPQRRAILEQLGLPFEVVPPRFEETPAEGSDLVAVVSDRAQGKARSVADTAGDCPVLGVDTEVVVDGTLLGKPRTAAEAEAMLERLSGRTHEVVSGLCLLTPAWEEVDHETTRVTFRALTARDLAHYVASGEWENRAGGYAIQGLGASLVEHVEGDYLNVVGLPASLLVRLLAERFAGTYGFG